MRCQSFILVTLIILLKNLGICANLQNCFIHTSYDDSLFIGNLNGNIIYSKNIKKLSIPASTLKILTALTAIHYLGADFRFKTEFYLDKEKNLKIKGYGDPFIVSEIWNEIAVKLSKKLTFINNIVIDDSYFSQDIKIPGTGNSLDPYNAPVGALCVNFNTIYFKKQNDKIISAEPQTPIIPFALKLISHINKGGRYVISHNIKYAERYAGELLKYFLERSGTKVNGKIIFGYIRPSDKLIYTYYSKFTLKEIIKKMMEYSNNFIANQIMLVMGAEVFGSPATLEKGILVIKNYAKSNLLLKNIEIVEGSGISKENHISCTDMAIILKAFQPYKKLLKKRGIIYYKTGTLNNIRARVGYIDIPGHDTYIFVLFFKRSYQDIDYIMDCIVNNIYPPHNASLKPDDLSIR